MTGLEIIMDNNKTQKVPLTGLTPEILIKALAFGHENVLTCTSKYGLGLTDDSILKPEKCSGEERDCNMCVFESLTREYNISEISISTKEVMGEVMGILYKKYPGIKLDYHYGKYIDTHIIWHDKRNLREDEEFNNFLGKLICDLIFENDIYNFYFDCSEEGNWNEDKTWV